MKPSILRWSLGGTQSSALNSPAAVSPRGTWAAILAGRSETSKDWIALTPEAPAIRRCQFRSRPIPRGVTSPMPVTTARRIPFSRTVGRSKDHGGRTSWDDTGRQGQSAGSAVRFDEADRILDGHDLFRGIIRNLASEFL